MTADALPQPVLGDHLAPARRIGRLLDPGSFEPLFGEPGDGVLAARGTIESAPVIVYCTDGARMGGALGAEACRHIADAIGIAVRERIPVLGLWHCGGARLAEGVEALDGVGRMFAGAAYGPALTDVVIMAADHGRLFVTGPDVVRAVAVGAVDEVIEPRETRRRPAQALAEALPCHGRHGNIPL